MNKAFIFKTIHMYRNSGRTDSELKKRWLNCYERVQVISYYFCRIKKDFKIHQTKRSLHWQNMTKSGQITFAFTTKSDQEIGLSDKILSAVYLTCIRPDFETPDTRHADIKQSRNFHVVKKINRLIRSLRTFCHSVSSVLMLLCKAMQKSSNP